VDVYEYAEYVVVVVVVVTLSQMFKQVSRERVTHATH
jgi:hypothetical protein